MSRDEATLLDIWEAAQKVLRFRGELERDRFMDDEKTQSAILHQLLVIGEATKRLSSDLRDAHPEIPWKPMAGMRDRLIHDYNNVDLEEVWLTATRDIPTLLDQLEPLVPEEP